VKGRWEKNIRMDLREIICKDQRWEERAQDRGVLLPQRYLQLVVTTRPRYVNICCETSVQ
jgi:hypothetical protein